MNNFHKLDTMAGMRVFVQVVDRGGFTAASEPLGLSPSAVSKAVTRLEDKLGVRLLHRTTRQLTLTGEGETYYVRARDILAAVDDVEAEVAQAGRRPSGRLRVSCVTAFALHQLAPALPDFAAEYPDVAIELAVTDRIVDLLAENVDVGIRTGPMADSSLVARKIAEVERGLFASPDYLARRGTPRTPDDLCHHDCIVLKRIPSPHRWLFHDDDGVRSVDIVSRIEVDSAEAALGVVLAGGGITRVGDMLVGAAIREGRLVPVMADRHVIERVPLSAIYPQGRHRMPKVRALLDFLVSRFGHAPWRRRAGETQA